MSQLKAVISDASALPNIFQGKEKYKPKWYVIVYKCSYNNYIMLVDFKRSSQKNAQKVEQKSSYLFKLLFIFFIPFTML